MIESAEKRRKGYVYYPNNKSKHTCLIHGPSHSSYEWKVLGDFCYKYSKIRPTKDRDHEAATKNKFNKQQ